MIVENNIDIIKQTLKDKIIKDVVQNEDGITLIFEDNTKFKIKSYQYQMLLG
jgi:hypothetical protein